MPLPMNSTAKRLGNAAPAAAAAEAAGAAPQAGTDSNQGRAIVTPTPRRKVRRDTSLPCFTARLAFGRLMSLSDLGQLVATPPHSELRAYDDGLH